MYASDCSYHSMNCMTPGTPVNFCSRTISIGRDRPFSFENSVTLFLLMCFIATCQQLITTLHRTMHPLELSGNGSAPTSMISRSWKNCFSFRRRRLHHLLGDSHSQLFWCPEFCISALLLSGFHSSNLVYSLTI